jgi:hypothetical protein
LCLRRNGHCATWRSGTRSDRHGTLPALPGLQRRAHTGSLAVGHELLSRTRCTPYAHSGFQLRCIVYVAFSSMRWLWRRIIVCREFTARFGMGVMLTGQSASANSAREYFAMCGFAALGTRPCGAAPCRDALPSRLFSEPNRPNRLDPNRSGRDASPPLCYTAVRLLLLPLAAERCQPSPRTLDVKL